MYRDLNLAAVILISGANHRNIIWREQDLKLWLVIILDDKQVVFYACRNEIDDYLVIIWVGNLLFFNP